MQETRHTRPPPRRPAWHPISTFIQDPTIGNAHSLRPCPQQRPSGGQQRGILRPECRLGHLKLPPHTRVAGPFSRNSCRGTHSSIRGQIAISFLMPHQSQTRFQSSRGVLPVVASALTHFVYLAIRKVIRPPMIHDRGLREGAVPVKGGNRRRGPNREGWWRRALSGKGRGAQ